MILSTWPADQSGRKADKENSLKKMFFVLRKTSFLYAENFSEFCGKRSKVFRKNFSPLLIQNEISVYQLIEWSSKRGA